MPEIPHCGENVIGELVHILVLDLLHTSYNTWQIACVEEVLFELIFNLCKLDLSINWSSVESENYIVRSIRHLHRAHDIP